MPSTIRYQPKALKSCFLIKPIRNRMASMETIKEITMPTSRIPSSGPEKPPPSTRKIRIFTPLAPSIAGIARKKENSAATKREQPRNTAPRIVAPDREVPGISASIWHTPISKAIW